MQKTQQKGGVVNKQYEDTYIYIYIYIYIWKKNKYKQEESDEEENAQVGRQAT